MFSTRCEECDKEFNSSNAYYAHRQDIHCLEATLKRSDDGLEIPIERSLKEPFRCLCGKDYTTKNGLKKHVTNCTLVSSVEFKEIETPAPHNAVVQRAVSCEYVTPEEEKDNSRLVKVLKLEPVLLKDVDGEEYAVLSNKDTASIMKAKKRLTLDIMPTEGRKKKKPLETNDINDHNELEKLVKNGPYSNVIDHSGYVELDADMAYNINKDWFIFESHKYYCSLLLAGAILINGRSSILINTIEVYGRTASTDPYHERFLNGKAAAVTTLPPRDNLRYCDVFVTVKKEDNSRKLIISTKAMNALVTSSIRIDHEAEPEVGSSTLKFTPSTDTKIFILSSQIDAAKNILTSDTVEFLYQHDILSQLRQVRSKFIESNGYMCLRASSPFTNYHNMKPYTIWTVNNYDDSSTTLSAAKLGSKLFQLIARCNLNNKHIIKKSDVEDLWEICNAGKIKSLLKLIIDECFDGGDRLVLKENKKLEKHLQEISKEISSTISIMNKKTAERILEVFKEEV